MNNLHFSFNAEAITLYRQQQQAKRITGASKEQRREQTKMINQARQEVVNSLAQDTLLRAVNAEAQQESLVWFWFNHFNVFWHKGLVGVALPDYINTVIRPHSQGYFKDLLLATLTHPAMIVYLDNVRNVAGHINENYARELLELHTLGVNAGYSQNDVRETARVLTGVGLRPLKPAKVAPIFLPLMREKGEFRFSPQKHEQGSKQVLGHTIKGQGFDEIETLVDILSKHPATAHHVSTKLAVFLLGDTAPADIITQAATVFSASNGDITKTITAITTKPPDKNRARSFKDPYRYILSAVRLLSTGATLQHARPLVRWLNLLAEPLFACHTPDGYSLYGRDWMSAGQLSQRFELAQEMVNVVPHLTRQPVSAERVLIQPSTQQLLATFSKTSRDTLAKVSNSKEQLALLLASPEFMMW